MLLEAKQHLKHPGSSGGVTLMDQKIVGIVGAVAGLASLDATQGVANASPNPQGLTEAKSYAELLDPIPNALATLRAADVAATGQKDEARTSGDVRLAYHHHHHHHHHRFYHHHHHHHWWRPRRYHHHHHHHHHHHRYY
jgi:hypothetical protein